MPKVEQYGASKVSSKVVRQPRASNVASGAFGGPVAKGLGNLAVGIGEMQKRVSTTQAEDALVRFEREKNDMFFNPDSGYFNTQGRDAFDGSEAASESLTKLQKRYEDEIEDSEAKRMFSKAASAHVTRGNTDIMRHAAKGLQAYEVATLGAQVENTIENASLYWNDPDRLRIQAALGEQAIIDAAKMQGLTGEPLAEKLQTYRSSFYSSTVSTAIASGSAAGKEALDQYGDRLEAPDKVKMEKALAAKQKSDETKYIASMAVTTASSIVDRYETRAEIIEAVNESTDHPELKQKTMREAMYRFEAGKKARQEESAEALNIAEGYDSFAQFEMENPELVDKIPNKDRKRLESGKDVETDWETYNTLMQMSDEELSKMDLTQYYGKLAPSQRKTIIDRTKPKNNSSSSKVDNQTGRTRATQTSDVVEQLFGKKSKRNDAKHQRVNEFYAVVDLEYERRVKEKGADLSSTEYTELLNDMSLHAVKKNMIFSDKELDFTEVAEELEIKPDDAFVIMEFLRDNNQPLTLKNIQTIYLQANQ